MNTSTRTKEQILADRKRLLAFLQSMPKPRPLYVIATELNCHYITAFLKTSDKVPVWVTTSRPFQQMMKTMVRITDCYGMVSGYEVVLHCLCNLQQWQGDDARRIKAELQEQLDSCATTPRPPLTHLKDPP